MQVRDIMNKSVVSVSPDEPTKLAASLLSRYNVGSLPVCTEDGSLRGIITDRDIVLRCVATGDDPSVTPVKEVMSGRILSVLPEDDIKKASDLMAQGQVRRLPVLQEGKVVGIVSLGDLAQRKSCDMEAAKALTEISANIRKR